MGRTNRKHKEPIQTMCVAIPASLYKKMKTVSGNWSAIATEAFKTKVGGFVYEMAAVTDDGDDLQIKFDPRINLLSVHCAGRILFSTYITVPKEDD